jgi:hypothetical protein
MKIHRLPHQRKIGHKRTGKIRALMQRRQIPTHLNVMPKKGTNKDLRHTHTSMAEVGKK